MGYGRSRRNATEILDKCFGKCGIWVRFDMWTSMVLLMVGDMRIINGIVYGLNPGPKVSKTLE
jgi:hypothetical protein